MRRPLSSTIVLFLAACTLRSSPPPSCSPDESLLTLVHALRVNETYLHLTSADISRFTGIELERDMTSVERQPSTGECYCCTTFNYDSSGYVRDLVIIRHTRSLGAASKLAERVIRASDLPPADASAPGDIVALYRWNVPDQKGRQLALDISIDDESDGARVRIVFALIGRLQ
jgi:hypothetical protein